LPQTDKLVKKPIFRLVAADDNIDFFCVNLKMV
jgi:hypothetical protein